MTLEEMKEEGYESLEAVRKDITQLQKNIAKAMEIIDNLNEENYQNADFDLEEGLKVIELFF